MADQEDEDAEIQKALDDFQEGMRTGCGHRAADGMRRLGTLEGSNVAFLLGMFQGDTGLYTLYQLKFTPQEKFAQTAAFVADDLSNLAKCIAAGDAKAVSQCLKDAMKVDQDDVELIAKLLEGDEHDFPYSLRLVQGRTGPPVDELAMKAKWFQIFNVFRNVYKPGIQKRQATWLVEERFKGRKGFSRASIYVALRYFNRAPK